MRIEIERNLIKQHPIVFSAFVTRAHLESESIQKRTQSAFLLVGEGWLPIVYAIIATTEQMNQELQQAGEPQSIKIRGMRVNNNKLNVSFSYDSGIDHKYFEKFDLIYMMSTVMSQNMCEKCGYHHMGTNKNCGTKCTICFAKEAV